MTSFLLSWKELIFFIVVFTIFFTPWSTGRRRYLLLGLFIYLLDQPLIANFHPGHMGWWLREPVAWITSATWLGAVALSLGSLKGRKGQRDWEALSETHLYPHLIVISLILLAIFLFNLPAISPQFKVYPDYSFAILLINVPLQYLIGFYLLGFYGGAIKSPLPLALAGVLLCVLLTSLFHLQGTISEYRALLNTPPTQEGATELIKRWEAMLERNKVSSIVSIKLAAYERIGNLKLWVGDLEGARMNYKKVLREDPDCFMAHVGLARLLTEEGRTGKAREAFQRVIERNPYLSWEELAKLVPPLKFKEIFILADVLEAQGRQKEAFCAYRQALQIQPQDPRVNFRLGRIYFTQGNYKKAIVAFQKTLVKNPRHLHALSYLIDIYEEEGMGDLAQQYRDIVMREVVTHRILPSEWQGRAGGSLYWKGGCYTRIQLYRGRILFKIYVRGTPAQGVWPHMVVKLNQEIIGEADVTTREFRPYSFTKDVSTGIYSLWIYFSNDLCLVKEVDGKKVREDRNLFVGAAEITYVR
ncbi:MAG: tetratricopeptide repeat protein [Deltaproteobacteria bacterium]|nr:tetratricopeptide repeat protein [Deltaproteobacteria bacterium]